MLDSGRLGLRRLWAVAPFAELRRLTVEIVPRAITCHGIDRTDSGSPAGFTYLPRGTPGRVTDRRFEFRFTLPYRLAGLPFGVRPSTCKVRAGAGRLLARFGPWRFETAIDNIADVSVTGPYGFVKTAGPAHLSLADRGLTFAPNADRGVCLVMREPVAGIEPFGLLRHPSLTVTVADCDGLVHAVQAG